MSHQQPTPNGPHQPHQYGTPPQGPQQAPQAPQPPVKARKTIGMVPALAIAAGALVLGLVIAPTGSGEPGATVTETVTAPATTEKAKKEPKAKDKEAKPEKAEKTKEAKPKAPKTTEGPTRAQEQALRSAQDYLNYTAFSKKGLIEQLEYEKFDRKDAEWAVDQLDVDWNEQAYKSALSYLDYTSFSLDGLIEQLKFEGFTDEQARYGAEKAFKEEA